MGRELDKGTLVQSNWLYVPLLFRNEKKKWWKTLVKLVLSNFKTEENLLSLLFKDVQVTFPVI